MPARRLADRMVTIDIDFYDLDTEVAVTAARSGLGFEDAARIVGTVTRAGCLSAAAYAAPVSSWACWPIRTSGRAPTTRSSCRYAWTSGVLVYVAPSDERWLRRKLLMDLVRHHCSETHAGSHFSGMSFEDGFEQEPIVNDAPLVGTGLEPMMPSADGETLP
ncbi:MAG: hypothetical protein U0X20_22235 [Caldilineaceae bacterium]